MRFILKMFFLLVVFTSPLFGDTPHLMLYFDINKTLIASDRAGGKSIKNVLNQLLASKYQFKWDCDVQDPISYDAYIRTILLPGSDHDLELKKKRKVYLDHFLDYLKERNHPLYPEVLKTYQLALDKLQNSKGLVFHSFYHLLEELDRGSIPYTLILRSFGSEVYEIAEEINVNYQKKFTHFGSFNKGILLIDNQIIGDNPKEIYEALHSMSHTAIRDDWEYWMDGKMDRQYGKPFIIDQSDDEVLGIFFDDNIELTNEKKNIISPINSTTGQPIGISKLANRNQIVSVDTLEAILDDDYFIELIQNALLKRNMSFSN